MLSVRAEWNRELLKSVYREGLERLNIMWDSLDQRRRFETCRKWTTENRTRKDQDRMRYPSDLTDEEWSMVEPLMALAKRGGRKREVMLREVVKGVMYVLSTGCHVAIHPQGSAATEQRYTTT